MNNAGNVTADKLLNVLCPMFTQFAAVARERQITKAASALDVPQPTVTRHVARLENVLGVRLCKRVQGGIALTPEGDSLVEPVEQALALLAQAIDGLDSGSVLQRISLGFLHTLGEEMVPSLLRRFGEEHPEYKFSLVEASADQLLDRLTEGHVELCLTSPLPVDPDIAVIRLGVQQLVLAVPAQHDLARETEIPLAAAASDDFVALEPHNYMRQMSDNLCRLAGFEPRITFEAAGISTLRGLVAAGLGVAIVPMAPSPVAGLIEVRVSDSDAFREIGLAWRARTGIRQAAIVFRDFVTRQFDNVAARGCDAGTILRYGISLGGDSGE
jgi:DNA-binding transcriptional LysR family regulator